MKKAIEKLERHIEGLEEIEKSYHRSIESLNDDMQMYESVINEKRQDIKELKKALAVTEKEPNSAHQYLLDVLERLRRGKESTEECLIMAREENMQIQKDLKKVVEQIEVFKATVSELTRASEGPRVDTGNVRISGGWLHDDESDCSDVNLQCGGTVIKVSKRVAEQITKRITEQCVDATTK